jgi:hypothetical protein
MQDTKIPLDVRSGGKGMQNEKLAQHTRKSAGGTPSPQGDVGRPGYGSKLPHSLQYVVERGSGSTGTAYNKRDHEVIDLERKPGNRIVARATCLDAELICRALNAFGR